MADMEKIKQLMEDGEKMGEVKKAVGKLSTLLDRVTDAQTELTTLLGGGGKAKAKKAKIAKLPHPTTKAPLKLCKVMGKTPQTAEVIAKKVGIKPATCKIYFSKFGCFQSAGRGKGYIYVKPNTTTKKKTTKKKSKKKT